MRNRPSYRASRAGDLIGFTRAGRPIYLAGGGSPEHEDPTPETDTDAPYVFPFAVPDDLSTLGDDELRSVLESVKEHAAGFTALPANEQTSETVRAIQACADLARNVAGVITERRENTSASAAAAAELAAAFGVLDEDDAPQDQPADDPAADPDEEPAPQQDPAPEPQQQPAAVTAAQPQPRRAAPSVSRVARRSPAGQVPADSERPRYASMTAAADVPGFASGQSLGAFSEAAQAISARLERYPTQPMGRRGNGSMSADKRPIGMYDPDSPGRVLEIRNFARHGAVQIRREFPDDLRISDTGDAYELLLSAASERRLPGGSLVASAVQAVKNGRSLTAAAGWCAPSETIYDLVELETMDGLLDVAEIQATRGGFQIPVNGGPDFRTIYTGIGNAGTTHLSEAQVIADTAKVCYDIPCPTFEDVRLGVDYVCLTGGLLQRRGYPEVVARFSRAAMTALAHKINQGVIAQMVADSGSAIVIPADPNGDDAISGILSAVELAIVDIKYRNRMAFNATVEIVLPMWVLAQLRAAATRRRGVDMVSLNDAEIMGWFAQRNAVPRFVYDWQDGFSGLSNSPGGSAALTALPQTVQFLAYPAGTWVKAVQDVVNLDTIYDSTKLATNEYTALFAEDGWAMLQMGPTTRLYTAIADPSGVTGCCGGDIS
jgi:hypothetical protein